jgi:hypothetical protein
MPYGSLVGSDDATVAQDIVMEAVDGGESNTMEGTPGKKSKESKGKKRKVESNTPKKSKKAKTV